MRANLIPTLVRRIKQKQTDLLSVTNEFQLTEEERLAIVLRLRRT